MLGATLGATTEAAAALLLYASRGFLGTAGFLIALALAALALGLWAGADGRRGRRWVGVIVAYLLAAIFAVVWSLQPGLRQTALVGALAALFLLAEPAYAVGAVFAALSRTRPAMAVPAFLGAAAGVLLAALVLIPRLQPGVIFLAAAAVMLLAAFIEIRQARPIMNANEFSLSGKCAIVTGVGGRGQVGFAVARALLDAGARVAVTSFGGELEEMAAELGSGTVAVKADLSNEDDVARVIATARENLGQIDVLVNLAGGLSVIKPLADTSVLEWQRELTRNAETSFLMSRAVLPHLRATRGTIINFASPAGERAVAQLGAYSAAKAAVIALTRALAIEEKPHGVRVNAIAPGMIDTEQNRAATADPARVKWVTRQQVANAVLFLASEASSGITGETIHVVGEGIQ
jgi:3-oxoacyl-[acyl-carrier protein] reductase/2-deoxy-D-gluconate 3-dehydrogenase